MGQLQAQRIVILGDFWHSAQGLTPALFEVLKQWRHQHMQQQVILVRGNHDKGIILEKVAARFEIEVVEQPFPLASGLYACHEPPLPVPGVPVLSKKGRMMVPSTSSSPTTASKFYLAGHLHPGIRLTGKGHDSACLPCFVWQQAQLVLPAFSGLAGRLVLELNALQQDGAKAGIVAPNAIWLV